MAKKRKSSKRSRSVTRTFRRYAGGSSGILSPVIQGGIANLAEQVGGSFHPLGDEAGLGIAYYITKNQTLGTILGMRLASLIPVGNLVGGFTGRVPQGGPVTGYA